MRRNKLSARIHPAYAEFVHMLCERLDWSEGRVLETMVDNYMRLNGFVVPSDVRPGMSLHARSKSERGGLG